ncbi:alpha amylase catalytic region [Catenulispora acidiphila DSM 44928]|uniref:Alpha amylase catalytic region n=1 Tax=Catenulispora acidiphila (strain DSM 44928 / JCM 14897 / NBRC 102108 / NRRL B-24433 / ID139908) TaxID=479433 RepID=C7Q3N3_CATAD|nr:glycoside hydrolase family 13 protein [Catenulispora acidiphila]ACU75798.1 alpha amylase catalytic region [Catenulispora acidiphila DSM 44928]
MSTARPWWRDAVVYQVYVKSFADGDGDGTGDLDGLASRLDHLERLGVDALWLSPCYPSPGRDGGYDIADYFSIDPLYGGTAALDRLVKAAHDRSLKVLLDIVPNHCSAEHPWFQQALNSPAGSSQRALFHFHDGQGADGELPPNNWQSVFGGSAWTRTTDPDGSPGQWYLHLFDSWQPDLNWDRPEVRAHFQDMLRHWFDKGVDGFRIDVAAMLVKADGLPDRPDNGFRPGGSDPASNQPAVHDIYRSWRAVTEEYADRDLMLVGEIWAPTAEHVTAFIRPGELHEAFYFDLMTQNWDAAAFRASVQRALQAMAATAPVPDQAGVLAWVLNSHDAHRAVSRYGLTTAEPLESPDAMARLLRRRGPVDVAVGQARARAALLFQLALPGAAFLYQGEELGLPEVMDIPDEARQDPIWTRSAGREHGRDGCRVPLPWNASAPSFGFSPANAAGKPWLPQPLWFADYAQDRQSTDPHSTLNFYRSALTARRALFAGAPDQITWADHEQPRPDVLIFTRGTLTVVTVFGDAPFHLSEELGHVTLASTTISNRVLPGSSTAWLIRNS